MANVSEGSLVAYRGQAHLQQGGLEELYWGSAGT